MKQLITILFAAAVMTTSCKKQSPTCYECQTAYEQRQICEGDPLYEAYDNNQVITDNSGNVYDCH